MQHDNNDQKQDKQHRQIIEETSDEANTDENLFALVLRGISILIIIFTFPLSLVFILKIVMEYQRVIIFRLGRAVIGDPKGPGLFCVIPCTDELRIVDMRTVSIDVPPQEILTKDSVAVAVDAVVFYHISDPGASVMKVENCKKSTQLLAISILRNVLGTFSLTEILREKDIICADISKQLDEVTDVWGMKVEFMEIKDVRIPKDMQRSMAAEAEAIRGARAKIIAAQGEKDSALALREASDVISDSPMAMQLRYLQTLSKISAEKNSTVLFPIPLELCKMLTK